MLKHHSNMGYLPFGIAILAAKGCDGIIAKLAEDLVEAGVLNVTQPGQTIYIKGRRASSDQEWLSDKTLH